MFYKLGTDDSVKTLYELVDSAIPSLQRDNDDLFIKERIPAIHLVLVSHLFYSYYR